MFKLPGVAETIDWAAALAALDHDELTPGAVEQTIGVLLKYQDDVQILREAGLAGLVAQAKATAGT
jgi:hypothetical protein